MNNNSLPTEAVSIYNSALENSNRGNYSTALNEYQQAIQMYPYFMEAYNNMGELYSIMGERDLAISIYNQALDIEKNHKILLNLGVEYYNSANFKTALTYFIDSVNVKTDFLDGHYYAGLASYNLKDYKTAEEHLAIVIANDIKHQKANYMLSHIYYEWKEYAKVIKCLEIIWDSFEDKSFLNKYYGFSCYHMGRFDDAIKYLRDALTALPEYSRFKDYLETLTYENKSAEIGDIDKAIKELETHFMSETPKLRDITKLSMLYIFKGQNKKAEEIVSDFKSKLIK